MRRGTVSCWKGTYGFLVSLDSAGKERVFVHWADIIGMSGHRALWPGDICEYEIEEGERGRHAVRVRLLESAAPAESQGEVSCVR